MSKTRDEYEAEAREVADAARARIRAAFQVSHPHYTPPDYAAEMLADVHASAMEAYTRDGQQYDRDAVWSKHGIHVPTLRVTIHGGSLKEVMKP